MRHGVGGHKLGRATAPRKAMFRSLATDLLRYEGITTTEPKAKALRPVVEKLITLGKRGDLHARRLAVTHVYDKKMVIKLFDTLAPRFAERPGGYTRIIKLDHRQGDNAPMARIELVE